MRRGRRDTQNSKADSHRINELIRSEKVRLVGEDGEPKVIPIEDALKIAREKELDLVEISPNQDPPVVKIIDYSKFRFEQIKKAKEAKKKQKVIHVKEIKMRPAIDIHDYEHKVKHAKEFMEKGDRVKFTIMFRGRELTHPELGFELMKRIQETFKDIGEPEKKPVKEGRNIIMYMNLKGDSKKKK
ncbi:translation initiation factor IF-3 [Spirochaetota bacterium]